MLEKPCIFFHFWSLFATQCDTFPRGPSSAKQEHLNNNLGCYLSLCMFVAAGHGILKGIFLWKGPLRVDQHSTNESDRPIFEDLLDAHTSQELMLCQWQFFRFSVCRVPLEKRHLFQQKFKLFCCLQHLGTRDSCCFAFCGISQTRSEK